MDIRPVKSEADYEAALAKIRRLMNAKPGTPEGWRLEVLGTLVEAYEREHFPMELPDPVEAVKFRMEQMGLKRRDLEKILGGRNRVSEVLNRRRRLTLSMIRGLSKSLDIPADVLVREYKLQAPRSPSRRSTANRQSNAA
jgi:HTH-type transcriptional regulator/antitoxin HigA